MFIKEQSRHIVIAETFDQTNGSVDKVLVAERAPALPTVNKLVWKLTRIKNHVIAMNGIVNPGNSKRAHKLFITVVKGIVKTLPKIPTIYASAPLKKVAAPIPTNTVLNPNNPDTIAFSSLPKSFAVTLPMIAPITASIPISKLFISSH